MTNKTPEKIVAKAGKKVGKALSVFESAANELDAAATQHLAASQDYAQRASDLHKQAEAEHAKAVAEAKAIYESLLEEADLDFDSVTDAADSLVELSAATEQKGIDARTQAANIRTLLSV